MRREFKKRKLTPEDVAFIMELRGEGVKLGYIAYHVYGVTSDVLLHRLDGYLEHGFL